MKPLKDRLSKAWNVDFETLEVGEITKTKTVKMNRSNYWLLRLIYGDAAYDKTARCQIPHNVRLKSLIC